MASAQEPLHVNEEAPTSRPRLLTAGKPMSSKLQWYQPPRRRYTRRELLADRIVNFAGAGLAWVGAPALGYASWAAGDEPTKQLGFWAHGLGLVTMLTCSALYHHWAWDWVNSHHLLSLDHIGISAMIMGCYAPVMQQCRCLDILAFVCALGIGGWMIEVWKFTAGRHDLSGGPGGWKMLDVAHVVRYLVMGWACVPAFPRILQYLPGHAAFLAVIGGVLYTTGIFVFVQGNLEFHMAIWHAKVVVASTCFYLANYLVLVGLSSDGTGTMLP